MQLCDNDHTEVCYEGRTCPVCAMRKDQDTTIADLQRKIRDLEERLVEQALELPAFTRSADNC